MNIPNYLSLARILAIPALVAMMLADFKGHEIIALVIFVFASLTDWLDGFIARRKGEVTVLGQLLDPTADKLLIASALICLVELKLVPASAAIIIIGREIAVTGFRAMASSKGINIPASAFGKAKMGSESWILGALVLGPHYLGKIIMGAANVGLWLVVALAIISALEYFVRFGPRVISQPTE
ncbi:MAG: CDP-diacylglycerol--glycerol-3-phosphate 3-phosphatidyltransferase [Candidatus Aminicenantes bacterium RBG_16_63_14]|nr:MAG: CDP-diacylglycerol--glycerol-3-phosphate 3-phosphatidyltransferase [Candidatus Aminicenantes bacterium RBG_16_63_14]OGD26355.1 MAG: CDP-diacylglycerol--glycerol-3-phosphate 3-phosphatidyltransferase [Candidatus Aminicenantes bacterium RBG_19FT_COMBO_65_30]